MSAFLYDFLIVGAGFSGSVIAECLASQAGKRILLVERRGHIGGNAYDYHDAHGVLVHRYGPHAFHTNAQRVFDYLSQFTEWQPYEHRVLAHMDGLYLPIPINRTTVNHLYGLNLQTDQQCQDFFDARARSSGCSLGHPRNAEEAVVARVGRDLYEKFFRGYTEKQWGMEPCQLDASVTARIPVRTNTDDRYFTDTFQALPKDGYTRLFERLLDHPNIEVRLNTDWRQVREAAAYRHVVFTGPVDGFFDHCLGRLPYRSLRFEFETREAARGLPSATVNYPGEQPYTRVADYGRMTGYGRTTGSLKAGSGGGLTTLAYEYPQAEGEPYYPLPTEAARRLHACYRELAEGTAGVTFAGRLGTYQYYNMDQVVAQALMVFERLAEQG